MIFNQGYYHPMDRSYHVADEISDQSSTNDIGVGVADIGMSVPMGIAAGNVQGLAVKIREGAGTLEIGFPGAGSGNRQAQTPGMYGKDTREAIRELAKINEIKLTTHSAYNVMGLSGQDQQGNFSKEYRKMATDEIRRAIDFAADTAQGGSVVVHTGEFERPISEEGWAEGGSRFRHFEEEPQRAVVRVVDKRTGQMLTQVRKNQNVPVAEWLIADKDYEGKYQWTPDNEYKDLAGKSCEIRKGEYVDYEGNKIIDPLSIEHGRLPAYDRETGRFKVKMASWDHFVKEAEEYNKLMEKKLGRSLSDDEKLTPEERHIRASLETNEGYSRGWALSFSSQIKEENEKLQKLRKARDFYGKIWENTPEEDRWKLKEKERQFSVFVPSDTKNPLEMIDKEIWQTTQHLAYAQQSAVSQEKQAWESRETQNNVISARKYALQEAKGAYADAAMHAFEVTQQKHLDKPVFITMENIFPERYGAHPEELKHLVQDAREEMSKRLQQKKGLDEGEARRIAETHIKATIDTGHFNMWRKYFQGSDQQFNDWLLKEVSGLAKAGVVGNVHLTDNFGYQDDHLAPGQGNTPVKEIVRILKKEGYKGALTVEPGADASTDLSDFHGLMKTWREFGSNVYGAGYGGALGPATHGGSRWGDIHYSYFGHNQPPYFVFGSYSPSNDWTLWSQSPME
jgi:hypothetical protein